MKHEDLPIIQQINDMIHLLKEGHPGEQALVGIATKERKGHVGVTIDIHRKYIEEICGITIAEGWDNAAPRQARMIGGEQVYVCLSHRADWFLRDDSENQVEGIPRC